MSGLKGNMLLQFSLIAFVVTALIAIAISVTFQLRLDRNTRLLEQHGAAMMAGTGIRDTDPFSIRNLTGDVRELQWITAGVVAGGFVALYVGLGSIVWKGARTITAQRRELEVSRAELAERFQERTEELRQANLDLSSEVAHRRRAQETLAQQAEELARSNQNLEQFAYVASHDLQEPLRMVAGYTQLLARRYKGKLDRDADEFIAYAVDGATRMQELINGLLAYSRVSAQGQPFGPSDCSSLFDQALGNLRASLGESGAVVTRDTLPMVSGDPLQLAQLFQNLVGNAIKFHGEAPPRVHASAERRGEEWLFSIRDNGIGIDPRDADRIFAIFQRLHGRTDYPGTGIGLAVCKRIVDRHGGRIWVESEQGKGATFYFTLPANGRNPP